MIFQYHVHQATRDERQPKSHEKTETVNPEAEWKNGTGTNRRTRDIITESAHEPKPELLLGPIPLPIPVRVWDDHQVRLWQELPFRRHSSAVHSQSVTP